MVRGTILFAGRSNRKDMVLQMNFSRYGKRGGIPTEFCQLWKGGHILIFIGSTLVPKLFYMKLFLEMGMM